MALNAIRAEIIYQKNLDASYNPDDHYIDLKDKSITGIDDANSGGYRKSYANSKITITYENSANNIYISKSINLTNGVIDNEEAGNTGGSTSGPVVTIGEEQVTLTPENVEDYIGKIVTNYKVPNSTETVTVGEETYTVSTTYRLYYVDFENKYGDGEGTVYLKADCTGNNYELQYDGSVSTSKIQNLNPLLFNTTGVSAPNSENDNMKAVTWLLDTAKWNGLVTSGANTTIASKINYVVGAPPLEMLMDSYNIHYSLVNSIPDYSSDRTEDSDRTKLVYSYDHEDVYWAGHDENDIRYGYGVGPNASYEGGYCNFTEINALQPDNLIGSMYYVNSGCYFISSPMSKDAYSICVAEYDGRIINGNEGDFCPLVSLQPDVLLTLQSN